MSQYAHLSKPDPEFAASPTDPEISSVLASSHANLPPTFFQICGLDPIRDHAFLYDRLLREAGCKTYVKVYVQFQHRATNSSCSRLI